MSTITIELVILAVLLIANGVFAMAEIALVSSRKNRLQMLADEGSAGATAALGLMKEPGVFLSTVQVGITLVGTLAGASSGAYLISLLIPVMAGIPYIGHLAEVLSTLLIVSAITYLSVVIGELVPKRIAIAAPEVCAARLSRLMIALSKLASPVVRLLDASSRVIARMLGVRTRGGEPAVSEDDIRSLLHQGTLSGVFNKSEQRMVEGVLDLEDLTAADLMTPRSRIISMDLDDSNQVNWRKAAESGHSYFPVYRGRRDNVLGLVSVKALWANLALEKSAGMETLLAPPVFVPETTACTKVIEAFRKHGRHVAIVVDEFGGVAGLITLNDMISAILGTLAEKEQRPPPTVRQQADGAWLADAMMDIEDLAAAIHLQIPEAEIVKGGYRSLGGFVLQHLGHVPKEGESFEFAGHHFEVIDMDRHRIDKVLIRLSQCPTSSP